MIDVTEKRDTPVVVVGIVHYCAHGFYQSECNHIEFLLTAEGKRLLLQKGANTSVFEANSWLLDYENTPSTASTNVMETVFTEGCGINGEQDHTENVPGTIGSASNSNIV